jgi:hypothetical protein
MLPLTVPGQLLEISLEWLGQPMSLYVPLSKRTQLTRIIHETRGRRSRIPEKQGLMGLVKSGARALFSRQGSVLASSIDRKVA